MIQEILNNGTWKRANNVVSIEITFLKRVYKGVDPFGRRKYKNVLRPKKIYGITDEEVIAKATQFLKENGYVE